MNKSFSLSMTHNDKELLLKDLCSRLLYGVKANIPLIEGDKRIYTISFSEMDDFKKGHITIIPYLRAISSMTEEEFTKLKEYSELIYDQLDLASFQNGAYKILDFYLSEVPSSVVIRVFDWLNKYHFDYRDLIQMGLAIAVTKENNPYE